MATTTTTDSENTRTLAALMVFTVVFALLGNEIKTLNPKIAAGQKAVAEVNGSFTLMGTPAPPASNGISNAGRIIIGGAIATSLLVLLSHAGPPGQRAAMGLATITFVTTTLVYGGPVWDTLRNAVGSNAGAQPTSSTTPTTPTTGTANTAAALSPLA